MGISKELLLVSPDLLGADLSWDLDTEDAADIPCSPAKLWFKDWNAIAEAASSPSSTDDESRFSKLIPSLAGISLNTATALVTAPAACCCCSCRLLLRCAALAWRIFLCSGVTLRDDLTLEVVDAADAELIEDWELDETRVEDVLPLLPDFLESVFTWWLRPGSKQKKKTL